MNPDKSSYLCFNILKRETHGNELVLSCEKSPAMNALFTLESLGHQGPHGGD